MDNKERVEALVSLYLYRHTFKEQEAHEALDFKSYYDDLVSLGVQTYVAKQLGTFITDAQTLLTLEYDEETSCDNSKFPQNRVQYYYLSEEELVNYIAFRTKVKRNEMPINKKSNFLILYLMEIINGLYGNDYNSKRVLLDQCSKLFVKGVAFKKLLIEAYEILFFQFDTSLDFKNYVESVNLPVLQKLNYFPDDREITEDVGFMVNYEDIYEMMKLKKTLGLTNTEEFLLEASFDEVAQRIDSWGSILDYESIRILTACHVTEVNSNAFIKLSTTFPIDKYRQFSLAPFRIEKILFGEHSSYKMKYYSSQKDDILLFFKYYLKSLRYWCDKDFSKYTKSPIRINSRNFESQLTIDNSIREWFVQNPKYKGTLNLTVKEIQQKINPKEFKLDIGNVSTVRKKSQEIQSKLIIEEENIEPIVKAKKPSIDESIVDNSIAFLCTQLNKLQKQVLSLLLKNKKDDATSLVNKNNTMLSLIVDEINDLSNIVIEDIIILDDCVVDEYKEELLSQLS